MRVAVVGGGQLSQALVAASSTVVQIQRREGEIRADIRDRTAVRAALAAAEPEAVILTAAITNVAWCEANPTECRETNIAGTRIVAGEVAAMGLRLVFLSTDYVFDGSSGPYRAGDEPRPINEYGRLKLQAEEIVRAASELNVVVRTCQLFGPDSRRRNFVLHVADEARRGATITASRDLYGTPTFAPVLATELLNVAVNASARDLHISGPDLVSRFGLAVMIADAFGFDPRLVQAAAGSADDVPRPRNSGLVSDVPMPPLAESLRALASLDDLVADGPS